jgi:hypothetical protein
MRSFVTCTLHQIEEEDFRRHAAHVGEKRNAYKVLMGNTERKEISRNVDIGERTKLK